MSVTNHKASLYKQDGTFAPATLRTIDGNQTIFEVMTEKVKNEIIMFV